MVGACLVLVAATLSHNASQKGLNPSGCQCSLAFQSLNPSGCQCSLASQSNHIIQHLKAKQKQLLKNLPADSNRSPEPSENMTASGGFVQPDSGCFGSMAGITKVYKDKAFTFWQ